MFQALSTNDRVEEGTKPRSTVRDRVVQKAIVSVIETILDHQFHERSFGFRHGCGAYDALRIVEQKLQEGYVYVVDADLKGYFDTIPKDGLMKLLKELHRCCRICTSTHWII